MIFQSRIDPKLDDAIEAALKDLEGHEPTSNEYAAIVDHVVKLEKLKSHSGLKPPSLDTVLVVGANLFGILWITRYERERAITSKALGFVVKPKMPNAA